jgi:hypothetical protein
MELPETRYTRSGDVCVAYQAFGDGPFNIVAVPGLWGAKTRFTPRDHADLQVKPSGDAPQG